MPQQTLTNQQYEMYLNFTNLFENLNTGRLALEIFNDLPPYIFTVPASSSGKYHPEYTLGEGGLFRHMLAAAYILNHLLSIDINRNLFTPVERDLLRVAALFHDGRKSGSQEDYERDPKTKFEHPILMANAVKELAKSSEFKKEYFDYIAEAIESHMGQWNTSKNSSIVLPLPITDAQKLVFTADYLASRKDLEFLFNIPERRTNLF